MVIDDGACATEQQRRGLDRRGTGIQVMWFHGERRVRERRGHAGQRAEPRIPLAIDIQQYTGGHLYQQKSADLSPSGMAVRGFPPAPIGSTVQLRFTLPDERKGEVIRCWAVLVGRRGPTTDGVRYRFVGSSRMDRQRIARFVQLAHERALLPATLD